MKVACWGGAENTRCGEGDGTGGGRWPIRGVLLGQLPQEANEAQCCWETQGTAETEHGFVPAMAEGVRLNSQQSVFESCSLGLLRVVGRALRHTDADLAAGRWPGHTDGSLTVPATGDV